MRKTKICILSLAVALVLTLDLVPGYGVLLHLDPGAEQVNDDGFGNRNNRFAWSMKTFGDYLYVGTLNSTIGFPMDCEECMEPESRLNPHLYQLDWEISEGAEIWRYDGKTWELVMDRGWGDIANFGVRNMLVHDGSLYAGTNNIRNGCQVWKTEDGINWEQVGKSGFGGKLNTSVRGMADWRGRLYVGTENITGGQVWSISGEVFLPIALFGISDYRNFSVANLQPHGDYLFAGTWNASEGCQVYRYNGIEWKQVVGPEANTPGGFGDKLNSGVLSMADFNGYLYVGTVNFVKGFTIWRTSDSGETWEKIGRNGFGDIRLKYAWDMEVYEEELYLGTFIIGWINPFRHGASLFKSVDGEHWEQLVGKQGTLAPPGFGDRNNYGFRTLEPFRGDLYVGTAQCFFCLMPVTGTEVWHIFS